jgi:hypothetical protein
MPAAALGHGLRGLGGKSAALAGKAAAFGVRFKLAIATMSVVTVGGLGVSAGPLLLNMTTQVNADRGTVQVLPVLPNEPSTESNGAIRLPFGPGLRQESTGTEINGPRAHQAQHGAADPNAGTASSSAQDSTGQTDESPNQPGTHEDPTLQEQDSSADQPQMSQQLAPNTGSRSPKTVTPTTDPTTTQAADPPEEPTESVWSTEYTTDGTTVWITRWTEVWEDTQGPPGR